MGVKRGPESRKSILGEKRGLGGSWVGEEAWATSARSSFHILVGHVSATEGFARLGRVRCNSDTPRGRDGMVQCDRPEVDVGLGRCGSRRAQNGRHGLLGYEA